MLDSAALYGDTCAVVECARGDGVRVSRRKVGFWYRLAAVLVKPPLLALFKRDWRGMEHIPAEGGFITVVNHNSHLDPLSYAHFAYNSGRVPRFLAKVSLFEGNGLPARFMRGSRQIPVYRESSDAAGAFRAAVDAIDQGECVAFYPEGTLTRDPDLWPMQGKTGAARVALETKAPVVPLAQWGAHLAVPPYARHKRLRLFPRKTFTVRAGPPVDLSRFYGKELTAEVLREATDTIMEAVTEQLAEIRGEPAPSGPYRHRAHQAEAGPRKRIAGSGRQPRPAGSQRPAESAQPAEPAELAEPGETAGPAEFGRSDRSEQPPKSGRSRAERPRQKPAAPTEPAAPAEPAASARRSGPGPGPGSGSGSGPEGEPA